MRNVTIIKPAAQSSAVAYARNLLARCEAGNVIAITAVEEHPGGTYSVQATETSDRLRTAGALLEAAVSRLGHVA